MAQASFSTIYGAAKAAGYMINPARKAYAEEARRLRQKIKYYENRTGMPELFESLAAYEEPGRITQGSVNRLIGRQEEARRRYDVEMARRKEEKRQAEYIKARTAIENAIQAIDDAVSSVSNIYAVMDAEFTANILKSMIKKCVMRVGYTKTYNRLKEWAVDFQDKLVKLVLAIYSKYYNTNRGAYRRDKFGNNGRTRFVYDITMLAKCLKVRVPAAVASLGAGVTSGSDAPSVDTRTKEDIAHAKMVASSIANGKKYL